MLFCNTWTGGQKHGYSQQCTKIKRKKKQKIGFQLLFLSKEEAIRCAVENDRKYDDLCMGATGYKTSWVTKN